MRLTVLRVYAHYLSCSITLPPTPRSSKWSLSLRSPHKKPCTHLSCLTYVPHVLPISVFFILSPVNLRPHDLNYLLITPVRNYQSLGFREVIEVIYLLKVRVLLPYVNYLDRWMNSVSLLFAGRKLESCRLQNGTKQKFLPYFCTDYTTQKTLKYSWLRHTETQAY